MLLVCFNFGNTLAFGFALGIREHLFAVLDNLNFASVFAFHVRLEFLGQVFDLVLMDLENVLKFRKVSQSCLFLLDLHNNLSENVNCALDFSITKFWIELPCFVVSSVGTSLIVKVIHFVFVFFIGLFTVLRFYKFIVEIFQVLKSCNSVLFVFISVLLLELIV